MGADIAIDLGTSRTRIYLQNKGIMVDEPSVITINHENDSIVAVGEEAYRMLGRTSSRFSAIYPLSGGVISDLGLVEAMISTLLKCVISARIGMPRAVACVPGEITEVEKRAVVNAISCCGIRRVCLIEEPVAAAIGAGVDIASPHGSFVVDIGGGTTDMAVISLSGIAVSRSVKQAGNIMDDEIIKYVKRRYNMLIGKRMAEDAKKAIGCVVKGAAIGKYRIKGRSIVTGLPAWADMDAEEMIEPLRETADIIVGHVQDVLEETPPELIGDIHSDGIIMTGGASQIAGFDKLISAGTDLRVRVADNPSECVVNGCGDSLRYIDMLRRNESVVSPITDRY